jgi:ABC-type uncharacterized transport system ATPase subunit
MDFGEIVAVGSPGEIVRHPRVIEAYLGTAQIGDKLDRNENVGSA